MSEAVDGSGGPTGAQAQREIESVQSTARWLVGGATAGLAALAAGLPLSSIFDLDLDSLGVKIVAALAAALALGSLLLLLVLSARVLVYPGWTLDAMVREKFAASLAARSRRAKRWEWLRSEVATMTPLVVPDQGFDVETLLDRHRDTLRAWQEFVVSGSAQIIDCSLDQASPPVAINYDASDPDDACRLERRLSLTFAISSQVELAANLAVVRRRYRRLVHWWLPVLVVTPTVALLALFYGGSQATDVKLTQAVDVIVTFAPDQQKLMDADVPLGCAGKQVPAVAVGGTLTKPVLVSATPDCVLDQVELERGVGVIVPKVPPKP